MSARSETRTTNAGFQIGVYNTEEGIWGFTLYGEQVAHLAPAGDDAPPRTDRRAEWTLTYRIGYPSTTVLSNTDEPPIDGVLFNLDIALEEAGYEP